MGVRLRTWKTARGRSSAWTVNFTSGGRRCLQTFKYFTPAEKFAKRIQRQPFPTKAKVLKARRKAA